MKAVIAFGEKQYLVTEGNELSIDVIDKKATQTEALMIIDGTKTVLGHPTVKGATVKFKIIKEIERDPKVTAIRYKAKKRVKKIRGHRQQKTRIKITSIKMTE